MSIMSVRHCYKYLILFIFFTVVSGCVTMREPQPKELVLEPVVDGLSPIEPSIVPEYAKLQLLLQGQGREGIGLEHESSVMLNVLYQVFSSEKLKDRVIHLVYTGQAMAYDPKTAALTVGGREDFQMVLAFIIKNVPRR